MTRLNYALDFTLRWEGGYVNDPADPGGATNRGITQATYDSWRAANKQPKQPVKNITHAEVGAIYGSRYWDACRCDELPAPVDLVVFDSAVNCGVRRARLWLQSALGVKADGKIGPRTLAAVREFGNPIELAEKITVHRAAHYSTVISKKPALKKFLNGWTNRLGDLKDVAGI